MDGKAKSPNSIFGCAWNSLLTPMIVSLVLIVVVLFIVFTAQPGQGQTFRIIHSFAGGDGANPTSGLTADSAGNLYGTGSYGGYFGGDCPPYGCGVVYKLSRRNGEWSFSVLHTFLGGEDGGQPWARVVIGPDGNFYGTTNEFGQSGYGTVFKLSPPPRIPTTAVNIWPKTVIYSFSGGEDGSLPGLGDLVFDPVGNMYGTTLIGGNGAGNVFQLTPSNGGWIENSIYSFGGSLGAFPYSGVALGRDGNLYGTTPVGGRNQCSSGEGCGIVYRLTPSTNGWTETILYDFTQEGGPGSYPYGGVIFDEAGNLYASTTAGGSRGGGTIFMMDPPWQDITVLWSLTGGPLDNLTMDSGGNLYGTSSGNGQWFDGTVFKLTRTTSGWTYRALHVFSGDDGWGPAGRVLIDSDGKLYGTTQAGGAYGQGVVWEITP